jgi:CO/xanthine dehydrogenase FAD-binding subunit
MAAEVLIPTSADEAVALYGDGDGTVIFAGGTILLPEIASGRLVPRRALVLQRSGMDVLRSEGGVLRIGAMVPVAALVDGPEPLLARYAVHVADGEVRRNATVGGNICAPPGREAQRGDLGAALIALGARVRSVGRGGERTEAVEDFLAGDRTRRLVLEVEIDDVDRRCGAAGMRRRHAHSYAIANVAACRAHGVLRVGVAGVGPTAVRCRAVEQSGDAEDVLKDVDPVDDAVASAAYRRRVLPRLVRQVLAELEDA